MGIMLNSFFVGGKRTRTADICLAKAALYQLSYTPRRFSNEEDSEENQRLSFI